MHRQHKRFISTPKVAFPERSFFFPFVEGVGLLRDAPEPSPKRSGELTGAVRIAIAPEGQCIDLASAPWSRKQQHRMGCRDGGGLPGGIYKALLGFKTNQPLPVRL